MQILRIVFILLLVLATAKLNIYSKQPFHTPAEASVLRTFTYSIAGGLVVNTLCGIAAPHLDPEIPARDSFVSCAPFGLAGTAIVARMHVYASGGWGREEWWYVNQLPKRFVALLGAAISDPHASSESAGQGEARKGAGSNQAGDEL